MPTNPEQLLRDRLSRVMKGFWTQTWHEDGSVNPGVPDVSYVFSGNFETGWLELKAERYILPSVKFGIRADQISWIRAHRDKVPVHILCQWGESYYLFSGDRIEQLNTRLTQREVGELCIAHSKGDGLRAMLIEHLQQATDRFRNVE